MHKYIQKRRRLWYTVVEIQTSLRSYFGRARFVKSLETDSETAALRQPF